MGWHQRDQHFRCFDTNVGNIYLVAKALDRGCCPRMMRSPPPPPRCTPAAEHIPFAVPSLLLCDRVFDLSWKTNWASTVQMLSRDYLVRIPFYVEMMSLIVEYKCCSCHVTSAGSLAYSLLCCLCIFWGLQTLSLLQYCRVIASFACTYACFLRCLSVVDSNCIGPGVYIFIWAPPNHYYLFLIHIVYTWV